jgi:hypothetical protein
LNLFGVDTAVLVLVLFGVIVGSTVLGLVIGQSIRKRSDHVEEPLAIMQGALLSFMGLVLAFGMSLAVGRYEARRGAVTTEANALSTTYLRAQTLVEPVRTDSLELLKRYADTSILLSHLRPGSSEQENALADSHELQRELWGLAGAALDGEPEASAPRLYVETLNETFDAQTSRVAGLGNRVPTPVLLLQVIGAAIALGLLASHVGIVGKGALAIMLAALLVSATLFVSFDLDRPTRGFIEVPSTRLDDVRESMEAEPAALGPTAP